MACKFYINGVEVKEKAFLDSIKADMANIDLSKIKTGQVKPEIKAEPIEAVPIKSEPIELNPASVKFFKELEGLSPEERANNLSKIEKRNPALYRAETEMQELLNQAENSGMWNPETREMQGQKLSNDAEVKAWLKEGGIERIEKTEQTRLNKLKLEAEALQAEFIKNMGKATAGLDPANVSILAKLTWNKMQQVGIITADNIRTIIDHSLSELNAMLRAAGKPELLMDKEDMTNVINQVRILLNPPRITPTGTSTIGHSISPLYSANTEKLANKKIEAFKNKPEPAFKQGSFKKWVRETIAKYRQRIDSPREMLNYAESAVQRIYDLPIVRNTPIGKRMEQLKTNASQKGKVYLDKLNEIVNPVKEHLEDFEDYLAARRIIDRNIQDELNKNNPNYKGNSRSTGGLTKTDAEIWINNIDKKVGREAFNKMVDAADQLQDWFDDNLKDLVKANVISPERYNDIKSQNSFYIPFDVIQRDFTGSILSESSSTEINKNISNQIKKIKGINVPKNAALVDKTIKMFRDLYEKGDIDVDGYYFLSNEYLNDAFNSGAITEAEFNQKMDALAEPGFELGSVLDRAQRIIRGSQFTVARQEYMNDLDQLVNSDINNEIFTKLFDGEKVGADYNVFTYYKDGKLVRVAADKDIVKAIDRSNKTQLNILGRVLNKTSIPFRLGATTLSTSFLPINFIIDVGRTLSISEAGLFRGANKLEKATSVIQTPIIYAESAIETVLSNLFKTDLGKLLGLNKYLPPNYKEWQESKSFSKSNISGLYDNISETPTAKERKFNENLQKNISVIFSPENTKAIIKAMGKINDVSYKLFYKGMSVAEIPMQIFEQTNKIFANKRLMGIELGERKGIDKYLGGVIDKIMKRQSTLTPEDRANAIEDIAAEVRNFAGSPDFENMPPEIRTVSTIFPFLGAAIKGNATDLTRLVGAEGGKGAKGKAIRANLGLAATFTIPAMIGALYMALDEDDERQTLLDKMDERNKNHNLIIPVSYIDESGNKVRDLVTIPIRGVPVFYTGMGRLAGQALASTIKDTYDANTIENFKEVLNNSLAEMNGLNISATSYGNVDEKKIKRNTESEERIQSLLSGINPVLKFPLEEAINKELYSHKDIIPDRPFKSTQNLFSMKGFYVEGMKPSGLITSKTSPYAAKITKILEDRGINIAPQTIDHFMKTFTADYARKFDLNPKTILKNRLLWKEKLKKYEKLK